tara:strand:- start:11316 stop:12191 length:876 start_codon:yes stop_codon:yes gene_type:complete
MRLSKHQLQSVNKSLFEIARKQKSSTYPVELPMPNFWDAVNQLTAHLEAELQETIRNEGMSAKSQILTRQLGNVRTITSDTTRIRLNAFTQHAILSNLMKGGGVEAEAALLQLSTINWKSHDPSERAFYQSLSHLVEKYKHDVSWKSLVNGGENQPTDVIDSGPHEPLTSFSQSNEEEISEYNEKSSIKSIGNEELEFIQNAEMDEEDRIRQIEAFPERSTGEEPIPPIEVDISHTIGGDLIRIRIIKDISDPIIGVDGSEMSLVEGDVESCPSLIAETLIAAGLAVAAPL